MRRLIILGLALLYATPAWSGPLSGYPAKTTPVDADQVLMVDSEAAGATKLATVGSILDNPSLVDTAAEVSGLFTGTGYLKTDGTAATPTASEVGAVPATGGTFTGGVTATSFTGTGSLLSLVCDAGEMPQYDGTDWVCIVEPSTPALAYTAGDNIDITSGAISVTGLNLADLSDAGAAAYLGASNGTSGHVAVWVDVCSDTSIPVANCVDNGGTLKAALPVSVGEAEIADPGGHYTAQNLQGILQEIAQTQGAGLEITEQTADPTAGTMSTGDLVVATGTGDLFYKSSTGLYTFSGTYAADATTCSTPTTGNILNEGFEGTGYENTGWTSYGTVDPDNTPSGTPPTDSCDDNLLVTSVGANSYITRDFTALTYPVEIEFDLRIVSEDIADGDNISVVTAQNSSGETVATVTISQAAGVFRLRATGADASAVTTATTGTWYTVTLTLAATESASSMSIDGGTAETFTRNTRNTERVRAGLAEVSATEGAVVEIDKLHISDGS